MKYLIGLCSLLLAGCTAESAAEHQSGIDITIINPHAYGLQAVIFACTVVIVFGVIHYWYRTKDKNR